MNDNRDDARIIAECRAGVSAMATAFVTRDPDALRYLSGVITSEPNLPASQFMLSAAHLVDDVLTTHVAAALGTDPTDTEIIQAWRSYEATARERNTSSPERLADEQIRAGQPEDEVRRTIANSVGETDAGLATALPLLTAYITGDEQAFTACSRPRTSSRRSPRPSGQRHWSSAICSRAPWPACTEVRRQTTKSARNGRSS